MNEVYIFLTIWVVLILPIAVILKTWLTPESDTTGIVMWSLIWPITSIFVIVGGLFLGLAGVVGWLLSTAVENISNKIRSKDK